MNVNEIQPSVAKEILQELADANNRDMLAINKIWLEKRQATMLRTQAMSKVEMLKYIVDLQERIGGLNRDLDVLKIYVSARS